MLLHLRENVRRTITHSIEVEEKIPLEQVTRCGSVYEAAAFFSPLVVS